jgi:hypothetical protein
MAAFVWMPRESQGQRYEDFKQNISNLMADIQMCCLIYIHKISVKTHHIL